MAIHNPRKAPVRARAVARPGRVVTARVASRHISPEIVQQVVELRREGLGWTEISDRVGDTVTGPTHAETIWDSAMGQTPIDFNLRLEVDRLDRLQQAIWADAQAGDVSAIDRALALGAARERLAGKIKGNDHALRSAFDATVSSSGTIVEGVDAALIVAGSTLADRIDEAVASGQGIEVTKALYLLPHLMNALDRMLATPQARAKAEAEVLAAARKAEREAATAAAAARKAKKGDSASSAFEGLRAVE